jgi:hypothetical protein
MPASVIARVVFWVWFGLAVAAGHFRLLQRLPALGVPGVIALLTAAVLYAYFRLPAVRQWFDSIDLRTLVLFHLTRFVGIYFLVLYQRGELPRAFAIPGGIGDIIVATMALPVALAPLDANLRLRAVVIWNVVGLIDILLVAATAARLNLASPGEMRALTSLPLSLLPTLLVPLIIATHAIIFARAVRAPRET